MDAIDRTIIQMAYANCRISYEALARIVKLTPNAVKNRVHNLIDSSVLAQFLITYAPGAINAESYQAVVLTSGKEISTDFVELMGSSPLIGHISTLATVRGGAYLLWGEFIGTEMLHELSTFLRNLEEVEEVDLYVVLSDHESLEGEFSNLQLKVLKVLRSNPLMQISEIAQKTNISPKSVRRALREITEGGKVNFIARPDLAAGSLVNIHIRIHWNEKKISLQKLLAWLNEKYPIEFWSPFASATEPMMIAEFVVEDLQEAEKISNEIQKAEFIDSSTTMVAFSSAKFSYLSQIKLDDLLDQFDG
ncbi:winged helix-turn-helix transcriptional regulator [Candidatus Thorarchaeota archaeon]|nr:MAG: winged helix-turn-helix transcriptional regulator [Candidatus Thorarchaeota archaeon]